MNVPMLTMNGRTSKRKVVDLLISTNSLPLKLNDRGEKIVELSITLVRRMSRRKSVALWSVVRYSIVGIYFWLGGTYLFGGNHVAVDPSFHLLQNIEPGGMRAHGLLLCVLAFSLSARTVWHKLTYVALYATLFYSVLTTSLITGGWIVRKPDLATPAWYVFVAVLSFALIVTPATKRPEQRDGGARA